MNKKSRMRKTAPCVAPIYTPMMGIILNWINELIFILTAIGLIYLVIIIIYRLIKKLPIVDSTFKRTVIFLGSSIIYLAVYSIVNLDGLGLNYGVGYLILAVILALNVYLVKKFNLLSASKLLTIFKIVAIILAIIGVIGIFYQSRQLGKTSTYQDTTPDTSNGLFGSIPPLCGGSGISGWW